MEDLISYSCTWLDFKFSCDFPSAQWEEWVGLPQSICCVPVFGECKNPSHFEEKVFIDKEKELLPDIGYF